MDEKLPRKTGHRRGGEGGDGIRVQQYILKSMVYGISSCRPISRDQGSVDASIGEWFDGLVWSNEGFMQATAQN